MPGQRPILAMSFIASLGILFHVSACFLPRGAGNFWPVLTYLFYCFLPLPILMGQRIKQQTALFDASVGHKTRDFTAFFMAGIVVSSFALPMLMARIPLDKPLLAPIQCVMIQLGNLFCYATLGSFCIYFNLFKST